MENNAKKDCRFFLGYKPCKFKKICENCRNYKPMGKRILIIKLDAAGDVLRTTAILRGLKRKYPVSYIVWLTDMEALDLLKDNHMIDSLLPYSCENTYYLQSQRFDILINLDKDMRAASLASRICAGEKIGFGLNEFGGLCPLNKASDYIFRLGLSDRLKFRINKLSYQQMCFDACGLDFKRDEYVFNIDKTKIPFADKIWKKNNVRPEEILIGLNTGAGRVFSTKRWPEDYFAGLADKLALLRGVRLALLGGPLEAVKNREILSRSKSGLIDAGCDNTLSEFAAILRRCNLVVTGDTLAMHIAIAQKIPVVALFGPTAGQEIELYGRGVKISSRIGCAPCYKSECGDMICMRGISPDRVFKSCVRLLSGMRRDVRCVQK